MKRRIAVYVRVSSRKQDTRSQEPDLRRWVDTYAASVPVRRVSADYAVVQGQSAAIIEDAGTTVVESCDQSILHGDTAKAGGHAVIHENASSRVLTIYD